MNLFERVRGAKPLVVHVTNLVTINDCANATLAIGASPVMIDEISEAADMIAFAGALVLNMGTVNERQFMLMQAALQAACIQGIAVVFDPVGAGATPWRQRVARHLVQSFDASRGSRLYIKGNAAELSFLAGQASKQKGVDSLQAGDEDAVRRLAGDSNCIAIATGAVDIASDGEQVLRFEGGCPEIGEVCGTGCMGASLLASLAAVLPADADPLEAARAYSFLAKRSAERARERVAAAFPAACRLPLGSLRAAFMDELALIDG